MPHQNSRIFREFRRRVLPIPETAKQIFDLVRDDGSAIVPVAIPGLEWHNYYPGNRFKITEGITRILFVNGRQPFRISELQGTGISTEGPGIWQYQRDELCVNGQTRGIELRSGEKPKAGARKDSALIDALDADFPLAGRVKSGYSGSEDYDSEFYLDGHSTHLEDTRLSVATTEGLDVELAGRVLVGWDAVRKLDMKRAIMRTTLAHFCRASAQIPTSVLDQANEVWETPFDPTAIEEYRALSGGLKAMGKQFGTDFGVNSVGLPKLVGA